MNYIFRRVPTLFLRYKFSTRNQEVLEQVSERVFQVMKSASKCQVAKLNEKATFEELGFDSLDGVEMVVALEENFGFDIKNEEAEKIQTVQDAISIFYRYTLERLDKEALVEKK